MNYYVGKSKTPTYFVNRDPDKKEACITNS